MDTMETTKQRVIIKKKNADNTERETRLTIRPANVHDIYMHRYIHTLSEKKKVRRSAGQERGHPRYIFCVEEYAHNSRDREKQNGGGWLVGWDDDEREKKGGKTSSRMERITRKPEAKKNQGEEKYADVWPIISYR